MAITRKRFRLVDAELGVTSRLVSSTEDLPARITMHSTMLANPSFDVSTSSSCFEWAEDGQSIYVTSRAEEGLSRFDLDGNLVSKVDLSGLPANPGSVVRFGDYLFGCTGFDDIYRYNFKTEVTDYYDGPIPNFINIVPLANDRVLVCLGTTATEVTLSGSTFTLTGNVMTAEPSTSLAQGYLFEGKVYFNANSAGSVAVYDASTYLFIEKLDTDNYFGPTSGFGEWDGLGINKSERKLYPVNKLIGVSSVSMDSDGLNLSYDNFFMYGGPDSIPYGSTGTSNSTYGTLINNSIAVSDDGNYVGIRCQVSQTETKSLFMHPLKNSTASWEFTVDEQTTILSVDVPGNLGRGDPEINLYPVVAAQATFALPASTIAPDHERTKVFITINEGSKNKITPGASLNTTVSSGTTIKVDIEFDNVSTTYATLLPWVGDSSGVFGPTVWMQTADPVAATRQPVKKNLGSVLSTSATVGKTDPSVGE